MVGIMPGCLVAENIPGRWVRGVFWEKLPTSSQNYVLVSNLVVYTICICRFNFPSLKLTQMGTGCFPRDDPNQDQ